MVSHLVPKEHALAGLLHDAAEPYTGDVAAPLKAMLPDYKAVEARVEAAVLGHFGLSPTLPAAVKHADLVALATEQRDLMPPHDDTPWECIDGVMPSALNIIPMQPYIAKHMFLARFHELVGSKRDDHRFTNVDWSAA
jgi:5'-deoxynucleotidase YfbR-like HD superfamily hydrolase